MIVDEVRETENLVFQLVQEISFPREVNVINSILVQKSDSDGLYRERTKLINSAELEYFRCPILLLANHPIIALMIRWYHVKDCHAAVQYMMNKLRVCELSKL